MIPRRLRAPPSRSDAFRQTASKAALVNRISTPKHPKRAWYCDTKEPFTSVRIRRRSGTVSGESVVIEGSREINSGMKLEKRQSDSQIGGDFAHPNLMRSTVSRWSRTSAGLRFEVKNGSCLDKSNDWDLKFAVNPIDYISHSINETDPCIRAYSRLWLCVV